MDEPCTDPLDQEEGASLPADVAEAEPSEPQQPPVISLGASLLLPGIILLIGMVLITAAGFIDLKETEHSPWTSALLVLGAPKSAVPTEAVPVAAHRVTQKPDEFTEELTRRLREKKEGEALLDALAIGKGPHFLAFRERWTEVANLIGEGRMPEPGAYEVLAGYLVPSTPFEFGGKTFTVSGRLRPSVGSLGYAYLAPNTETIRETLHAVGPSRQGWILPDGLGKENAKALAGLKKDECEIVASPGRSSARVVWLCLLGLVIVAIGGSLGYIRVLRWMSTWWHGAIAAPLLQTLVGYPRSFAWTHVVLYGSFFGLMVLGVVYPQMQSLVIGFVQHQFSEGGLSYIGDAYAQGSIPKATAATFFQNFFVATVATTLCPSVLIPLWGLFKNMATFALAGFAMAPVWLDTASRMSYHCLTMVLEFEAYIVATFAAILWPRLLFGGRFGYGLHVLAGAVLVSGGMLLFAALYEASTLILLAAIR